jgi:hypothetical protein
MNDLDSQMAPPTRVCPEPHVPSPRPSYGAPSADMRVRTLSARLASSTQHLEPTQDALLANVPGHKKTVTQGQQHHRFHPFGLNPAKRLGSIPPIRHELQPKSPPSGTKSHPRRDIFRLFF